MGGAPAVRRAKGSIRELVKGRKYQVSVTCGVDPSTGRQKRAYETVRGSRRDAEERLAAMLVMYGKKDVARQRMSLDAFYDGLYLPHCKENLRQVTWNGYDSKYRTHIKDALGGYELDAITPAVIDRWLSGIDGQKRRFEAFKTLRQMMNRAVRWNLVDSNPCDRVDVPRRKKTYEPTILTPEEASTYIQAFRGTDVEAAVLVALGGGLRRSEVAALDWDDITEDGVVTVDNGITTISGHAIEGDTKTEFSTRRVHLPKSISGRLNEIRGEGAMLVCNGGRMNPDIISKHYNAVRDALPDGIQKPVFKDLRHSSLSMTYEATKDILAVSRRGGHSSTQITERYYVRTYDKTDTDAASKLDGILA